MRSFLAGVMPFHRNIYLQVQAQARAQFGGKKFPFFTIRSFQVKHLLSEDQKSFFELLREFQKEKKRKTTTTEKDFKKWLISENQRIVGILKYQFPIFPYFLVATSRVMMMTPLISPIPFFRSKKITYIFRISKRQIQYSVLGNAKRGDFMTCPFRNFCENGNKVIYMYLNYKAKTNQGPVQQTIFVVFGRSLFLNVLIWDNICENHYTTAIRTYTSLQRRFTLEFRQIIYLVTLAHHSKEAPKWLDRCFYFSVIPIRPPKGVYCGYTHLRGVT